MGHDKTRSGVSVGNVDWNDPKLNDLLKKVDDWNIDQRNPLPPQNVQIRIACGFSASNVSKPALLISDHDEVMVLITHFPLPHGEEVQVNNQTSGKTSTRLGVVIEEREGHRVGDKGEDIFLNWLRVRSR
ncbi:hypothetical protein [Dyella acidisoli]|uniref:Uncharacterized protein n=1 Tax=Dyella acidisoli TaxID=1867834 RepID=A0ABQ5XSU5_9GAMM|nr:hypothetical protein [Dyella acidisoli]GLQ93525.1 hypothetical protein GCM10007901_24760 [Dyella acidisoli]